MACTILPIIRATCPIGRAGVRRAWLIDAANIEDITFDEKGCIDSITVVEDTGFTRLDFEKDTAFLEQTNTRNGYNINTTQTLSMIFPIMSCDLRWRLRSIFNCACGVVAIVKDNNNQLMVVGIDTFENGDWVEEGTWEPIELKTGESTGNTGADPTADRNEYLVTLTGNSNFFAPFTTFGEDEIPLFEEDEDEGGGGGGGG